MEYSSQDEDEEATADHRPITPANNFPVSTPSGAPSAIKSRIPYNDFAPSSPVKKRSRGLPLFKMFGYGSSNGNESGLERVPAIHGSLFPNLSQDSVMSSSQFSQDFAERIGELSVNSGSDMMMSNFDTSSMDKFSIAFPTRGSQPTQSSAWLSNDETSAFSQNETMNLHTTATTKEKNSSIYDQRIEVGLPLPMENPFVRSHTTSRPRQQSQQPRTMWITAFGERSRLNFDFEVFDAL